MLREHKINRKMLWVETEQLTEKEKNLLLKTYHIPLEILDYVTDVYEQSNYIFDPVNNLNLIIFHMPVKLNEQDRYTTRPISFLIKQDILFTFNEGGVNMDAEILKKPYKNDVDYSPIIFMLDSLDQLIDCYVPILREITKARHKLDDLLTQRLTNKDLIRLSYLQQTLTFLQSATESNVDVLEIVTKSKFGQSFAPDEKERLEDVLIETEQVTHMTDLEAKIVNKIARIFDSIMNNNLNDTMKFLTVWSLALAIPTLITGFYGMNIKLPKLDADYGWAYLVLASVLLIIWLIFALKKNRKM